MQIPLIGRVNWYRARVQWCVRGTGVILLGWGVYLFLKRVLFAMIGADFKSMVTTWNTDLAESSSFYRGLALIVVGGMFLLLARPISRFVVALPSTDCPGCGHAPTPNRRESQCPECGLIWDAASQA